MLVPLEMLVRHDEKRVFCAWRAGEVLYHSADKPRTLVEALLCVQQHQAKPERKRTPRHRVGRGVRRFPHQPGVAKPGRRRRQHG